MRNNENLNMVEAVGMERKGKRSLKKSTHRTDRNWQWNREMECAKGAVQDLLNVPTWITMETLVQLQKPGGYVEKVWSLLV